MVDIFKSKNLQSVKHGFFCRSGGVSTGIYSSLNLSEKTSDSKANIYGNRALVLNALDISSQKVFFPNQQHTNNVVFIDKKASNDYPDLVVANDEHYSTEFLDLKIAIKIVENEDEAIKHVNKFSSGHTEGVLTESEQIAEKFSSSIDSSVIFINASTRFTDGEMFGFGAEIGISTQKLHVRGPMGLEALTTERYVINGKGTVRG